VEVDHSEQAIFYDWPRSVTFRIERVLDERRQCLVDLRPITGPIPPGAQQDMCQPLMMSRCQFMGFSPGGARPALGVAWDSECGLQISFLSRNEGLRRGKSGALVHTSTTIENNHAGLPSLTSSEVTKTSGMSIPATPRAEVAYFRSAEVHTAHFGLGNVLPDSSCGG